MQRTLITIVTILFGALTAVALWKHGYWGIVEPHFKTFGAAQVLADLTISLTIWIVWMWKDAKSSGRTPWPWLFITLILGSFGPLFYLLTRKSASGEDKRVN